jgi:hypothetical protein
MVKDWINWKICDNCRLSEKKNNCEDCKKLNNKKCQHCKEKYNINVEFSECTECKTQYCDDCGKNGLYEYEESNFCKKCFKQKFIKGLSKYRKSHIIRLLFKEKTYLLFDEDRDYELFDDIKI